MLAAASRCSRTTKGVSGSGQDGEHQRPEAHTGGRNAPTIYTRPGSTVRLRLWMFSQNVSTLSHERCLLTLEHGVSDLKNEAQNKMCGSGQATPVLTCASALGITVMRYGNLNAKWRHGILI